MFRKSTRLPPARLIFNWQACRLGWQTFQRAQQTFRQTGRCSDWDSDGQKSSTHSDWKLDVQKVCPYFRQILDQQKYRLVDIQRTQQTFRQAADFQAWKLRFKQADIDSDREAGSHTFMQTGRYLSRLPIEGARWHKHVVYLSTQQLRRKFILVFVEGLQCKRPIQCLASSEILTPPTPSLPGECVPQPSCCTPPPLVRGEDTFAGWRVRCTLYMQVLCACFNLCTVHVRRKIWQCDIGTVFFGFEQFPNRDPSGCCFLFLDLITTMIVLFILLEFQNSSQPSVLFSFRNVKVKYEKI